MRSFGSDGLFTVPPDIVDSESSTDTVVREGSNTSLTCTARGHPPPHILWRREDGSSITKGKLKGNTIDFSLSLPWRWFRLISWCLIQLTGSSAPPQKPMLSTARYSLWCASLDFILVLTCASLPTGFHRRYPSASFSTYSVWPAASIFFYFYFSICWKFNLLIRLSSIVAPVLWIPNQLEGTVVGRQVSLVCQIEAFPIPIVYWTTENGEIIIDSKHIVKNG